MTRASARLMVVGLAAALMAATPTAASAAETALFVDATGANLRDGPGQDNTKVIGALQRGDEVRVKDQNGQWRRVWVAQTKQVGWVAHWLLSEVPPEGFRREVAYVASDGVSIRTGPGENHDRKGVLNKGVQVDVIAYAEQWRKVRVPSNGEWGYVAGWLLKTGSDSGSSSDSRPSYYGESRTIGGDGVNLRSNPTTGGEPLSVLSRGTIVYLMQLQEKWAKVQVHEGPVGWVSRDYLKPGGPVQGSKREWGKPRYVGVDQLYLRPGPTADNRPMALLTKGKTVYLMFLQEDWAQVHVYGGDIGWVFRDYLRETEIADVPGQVLPVGDDEGGEYNPGLEEKVAKLRDDQGVVRSSGSNIRSGPGTNYVVVAVVTKDDVLTVHGEASGWLKVTHSSGQTGWIANWLCETKTDPPDLPASQVPAAPSVAVSAGRGDPQGMGKRIAELALAQVGKPYVWSAEDPRVGFDCSGLAYWAHGQVGIGLMRVTDDIWADPRGRAVAQEDLQPGDVVCFANTYRRGVSHVGVYVGEGKFVHAPGHGQTVRVDRLADRGRSYCGARRFYK